MKQNNYSVSIFFEKRVFKKGTNLNPLELTVNLQGGIQFRIRLKLYSTRDNFDKAMSGKSGSEEVKELRREINEYVSKAETILERLQTPTKDAFIRLFKSDSNLFISDKTNFISYYEQKEKQLTKDERFSCAALSKLAINSFKKYSNVTNFEDIDEKWVKGYIIWMRKEGRSSATTSIYLRNFRSLFNECIRQNIISIKTNPFKDLQISDSSKSKDVLYPEQIKKLWEYKPLGIMDGRAKAMFFFCYLCNGANFKDVSFLKFRNINKNILTFVREKTKTTTKKEKSIKVYLRQEMMDIINEWGVKDGKPDDFIFPIVNPKDKPERQHIIRMRKQLFINKQLHKIGERLEFEVILNLALARHAFATTLKLDKVPVSFISEAMGHSSTTTTEHYLKSLPDELYLELSKSLLKF